VAGAGEVTDTSPGAEFSAISCGSACEAEYNEGATIVLTANPLDDHLVAWTGCEIASGNECTVTMSAAKSVHADFSHHAVTVIPTGGGSVSATEGSISSCFALSDTCTGEYEEDSTITLIASPFAHRHVIWTGCKEEPSPNECKVLIGASPAEVQADFLPYTHTLTLLPAGSGFITASSGAISECTSESGVCAGKYIEGSTVILIATPAAQEMVTWRGCTQSDGNICEVEIGSSDTEARATFSRIADSLSVNKAGTGQGTISCNGEPCAASYPEGTALTLTATPASGSTFAGWSGAGCSGNGACQLTLNADTHLTATFNANPPPPAEEKCLVPKLAGKTLAKARSVLTDAHCALGKVSKPRPKNARRSGPLIVKSSSPAAGAALPAATKVDLKLGPKPKRKH